MVVSDFRDHLIKARRNTKVIEKPDEIIKDYIDIIDMGRICIVLVED